MSSFALKTGLLAAQRRLDPDAAQWRSAVRIAGAAVSDGQAQRVNQLVKALKSAGVWSTLDRLWLFAAENSTQALIDLVTRSTATNHSATFTAARGFKGNASNQYIDTGFNPGSGTPNYTRDDAGYGCWIETPQTSPVTSYEYMSYNESIYGYLSIAGPTLGGFGVNNASAGTSYITRTPQTGAYHAQRTASNATALYQDGTLLASSTQPSAAVSSHNFFALAGDNNGSPYQATDGRLAAVWMGKSLSPSQVAALCSAQRAYMTAVGVT